MPRGHFLEHKRTTQHQSVANGKGKEKTAMDGNKSAKKTFHKPKKEGEKTGVFDAVQCKCRPSDHESPPSIITSVLLRFLPSSTTRGRSGCFTSTASATRCRALDTLTCRATLTWTICRLKRSVPVG